jgi:membrane protease YdiL (CAAX protease family)
MTGALLTIGVVAQAIVWHLVGSDRVSFWPAIAATLGVLGLTTVAVVDVSCCAATGAGTAAGAGVAAGLGFYAATRAVVGVASRWAPVRGSVSSIYRRADEASVAAVLALSSVTAVGEELFWRGLVQPELRAAVSPVLGAALSWIAYVGANAAAANLPLLAAAVVGGAIWTALGAWSDGVVAPIASHVAWTGLMVAWPPSGARDKVAA